jgi:hypothetical protein
VEVVAEVADEVDVDASLREAPPAVVALEAVEVAAGGDGLQGKFGRRLQDGDIGARARAVPVVVEFDDDVAGQVLGAGCAVVVDDDGVCVRLRCRPASLGSVRVR